MTHPNQNPDLESRLARLEQQNRRLKRGGLALGALTLVVGLASAASVVCKTVWAERFVLKDARGRERLVLDAYQESAPTISFHDARGRQIAKLSVDDEGEAVLEVRGSDLGERATLRLSETGSPFLDFGKQSTPKEGYSTH